MQTEAMEGLHDYVSKMGKLAIKFIDLQFITGDYAMIETLKPQQQSSVTSYRNLMVFTL